MLTVWKYKLKLVDGPQEVYAPATASVLHVAEQDGRPTIWMELDTSHAIVEPRYFVIVGTGHSVRESDFHVGSYLSHPFVWHVYEEMGIL